MKSKKQRAKIRNQQTVNKTVEMYGDPRYSHLTHDQIALTAAMLVNSAGDFSYMTRDELDKAGRTIKFGKPDAPGKITAPMVINAPPIPPQTEKQKIQPNSLIESLGFSDAVVYNLHQGEIKTVGHLAKAGYNGLVKLPRIGKKKASEIMAVVKRYDLLSLITN